MTDTKGRQNRKQPPGGVSPAPATHYVLCGACAWPHDGTPEACEKCGVVGVWRAAQNTDGLTLDRLRRFALSARDTANRTAVIAHRWVASFFLYTATLDDPEAEVSDEVLGLFWVRLHGVIAELPERLANGYFAGTTEEQARAHPDPNVVRYAALMRRPPRPRARSDRRCHVTSASTQNGDVTPSATSISPCMSWGCAERSTVTARSRRSPASKHCPRKARSALRSLTLRSGACSTRTVAMTLLLRARSLSRSGQRRPGSIPHGQTSLDVFALSE